MPENKKWGKWAKNTTYQYFAVDAMTAGGRTSGAYSPLGLCSQPTMGVTWGPRGFLGSRKLDSEW
jgi:hypothetical protein